MIRRKIQGVSLDIGSKYEFEHLGWDISKDCFKLDNGLYLFTRGMRMDDLAKVAGFQNYDCSVPQEWFDQYIKQHGEAPKAIWCYDVQKTFGAPVTANEMFRILDAAICISVPFKVEEMDNE